MLQRCTSSSVSPCSLHCPPHSSDTSSENEDNLRSRRDYESHPVVELWGGGRGGLARLKDLMAHETSVLRGYKGVWKRPLEVRSWPIQWTIVSVMMLYCNLQVLKLQCKTILLPRNMTSGEASGPQRIFLGSLPLAIFYGPS